MLWDWHITQLSSSSCSWKWCGSGEGEEKIEKSLFGFVRERGQDVQWRGETKKLVPYWASSGGSSQGLGQGLGQHKIGGLMYFNRIFKHWRVAQVARQPFPNQEASLHLVTVRKKGNNCENEWFTGKQKMETKAMENAQICIKIGPPVMCVYLHTANEKIQAYLWSCFYSMSK